MLRAIQEIKPTFVIAENVFGITNIDGGLVFQQVCLDLEAEGYEVQPFIIPAAAKNAPHRRDRCWFIAQNPLFSRCLYGESYEERAEVREFGNTCTRSADRVHLSKGDVADTNGNGFNERNGNDEINTSEAGEYALGYSNTSNVNGNATNPNSRRTQTREVRKVLGQSDTQGETGGSFNDALQGNVTDSCNTGLQRSEFNGTFNGRKWNRDESYDSTSKLCQVPHWRNFPTQSPICSGDVGLPTELDGITFPKWRAESIKGYGNAIVPQIALQLFQILQEIQDEFARDNH
jgi:DNA (cytosine-5)-methyltransferase 1